MIWIFSSCTFPVWGISHCLPCYLIPSNLTWSKKYKCCNWSPEFSGMKTLIQSGEWLKVLNSPFVSTNKNSAIRPAASHELTPSSLIPVEVFLVSMWKINSKSGRWNFLTDITVVSLQSCLTTVVVFMIMLAGQLLGNWLIFAFSAVITGPVSFLPVWVWSSMSNPLTSPSSARRRSNVDPENLRAIHQRYEDTSLVIHRQYCKNATLLEPSSYLVFGESRKHFSYSKYGNASVIVRKSGRNVTKMDEKPIESAICVIMWSPCFELCNHVVSCFLCSVW